MCHTYAYPGTHMHTHKHIHKHASHICTHRNTFTSIHHTHTLEGTHTQAYNTHMHTQEHIHKHTLHTCTHVYILPTPLFQLLLYWVSNLFCDFSSDSSDSREVTYLEPRDVELGGGVVLFLLSFNFILLLLYQRKELLL